MEQIINTVYSNMEVDYIDGYGSDILVVNSARVSFSKKSDYLKQSDPLFESQKQREHHLAEKYINYIEQNKNKNLLKFNDFRLIHFLAKKNHWTPFGHGSFTFKIKAPIFVARQLGKHQTGLVWNEVSRRYYDGPIELFEMNYKNSSGDKRQEGIGFCEPDNRIKDYEKLSIEIYNKMLKEGAAAEDIRSLLPQNMMTEWYWSGTIAAFMRIVKLRSHVDTQRQTRVIANKISEILKEKVPVSYEANFNI